MPTDDRAIPVLPSRSVDDTVHFYQRLGFTAKVWGAPYQYAILCRGTLELHFFTHPELRPAESCAGCYLRVANVQDIYDAFTSASLPPKGIPRRDALETKPWGMREFAVVDPDGNLIRIGQIL